MSEQINLKCLENWISNVSTYPPAEIFFQAPKSQEKKEKRCKEICEQLYRFNWEGTKYPNPIGTVRELIREMAVVEKMFKNYSFPPKYENIVKLVAKFEVHGYHLHDMLEIMHESHPALVRYYEGWRLGLVQVNLSALNWATEILRLPKDDESLNKFVSDVSKSREEMK